MRLPREHLGLVVSATLGLTVALSVFGMAGFDTTTAVGLVESAGTGTVLISVLIANIPTVVGVGGVLLVAFLLKCRNEGGRISRVCRVALGLAYLAVVGWVVPVFTLCHLALLMPYGWWLLKRSGLERDPGTEDGRLHVFAVMCFVTVGLTVPTLFTTSWLPARNVTLQGEGTSAAYVVGERDAMTVLLPRGWRAPLREVETVRLTTTYCQDFSLFETSALKLISNFRPYPPCSD